MKAHLLLPAVLLFSACSSDNNETTTEPETPQPVTITTNFDAGAQGWSAGFSDYPVADADSYELESGIAALPTDADLQGFRLKGQNNSSDLFMFLKAQVIGLVPNTNYTLHGSISFLSNAGEGCGGVGGPPGESVYVKLGASEIEPEQADFYLNIDKGNQSQPGNDALVVGNVAAADASCDGSSFSQKTIDIALEDGFEIQSSTEGTFWVMVGTDSGFAGTTELYYTEIILNLTP